RHEPHAGQRASTARVLHGQDAAIGDEGVAGVALLDEESEAITAARVGREVEVGLEDVDEREHELWRRPDLVYRLEDRRLDRAVYRLNANLVCRLLLHNHTA